MARSRRLASLLLLLVAALTAFVGRAVAAGCTPFVSENPLHLASAAPPGQANAVQLSFLGHASFLIESPAGVTIVTDYNGVIRPDFLPDIVTMNHAHSSHYTDHPDPGIRYVLRGWDTGQGPPHWDLRYRDVRIRNVLTNIRDGEGGTELGGNSIFVFETADLCIAHLSHLHHTLTPDRIADLGQIDVLMAPVDGMVTLSLPDMIEVIGEIHPLYVIPMHYFGPDSLDRFLAALDGRYPVTRAQTKTVALTRAALPKSTEVLVLPGF